MALHWLNPYTGKKERLAFKGVFKVEKNPDEHFLKYIVKLGATFDRKIFYDLAIDGLVKSLKDPERYLKNKNKFIMNLFNRQNLPRSFTYKGVFSKHVYYFNDLLKSNELEVGYLTQSNDNKKPVNVPKQIMGFETDCSGQDLWNKVHKILFGAEPFIKTSNQEKELLCERIQAIHNKSITPENEDETAYIKKAKNSSGAEREKYQLSNTRRFSDFVKKEFSEDEIKKIKNIALFELGELYNDIAKAFYESNHERFSKQEQAIFKLIHFKMDKSSSVISDLDYIPPVSFFPNYPDLARLYILTYDKRSLPKDNAEYRRRIGAVIDWYFKYYCTEARTFEKNKSKDRRNKKNKKSLYEDANPDVMKKLKWLEYWLSEEKLGIETENIDNMDKIGGELKKIYTMFDIAHKDAVIDDNELELLNLLYKNFKTPSEIAKIKGITSRTWITEKLNSTLEKVRASSKKTNKIK